MLRPHAPVAERVIVPGDPGRAMRLAVALTDAPKMLNHHRGLWGYTGLAADGEPLTVQSTGIGGPSAAAVVFDLAALGARRVVRVGTCTGVDLPAGTLLRPEVIEGLDGTSRALRVNRVDPVPVTANRVDSVPENGTESTRFVVGGTDSTRFTVASTDLPTQPVPPHVRARDLTSAAVVAAAEAAGLEVAVLLVVADGLDDEQLHAAELTLGHEALALLT